MPTTRGGYLKNTWRLLSGVEPVLPHFRLDSACLTILLYILGLMITVTSVQIVVQPATDPDITTPSVCIRGKRRKRWCCDAELPFSSPQFTTILPIGGRREVQKYYSWNWYLRSTVTNTCNRQCCAQMNCDILHAREQSRPKL